MLRARLATAAVAIPLLLLVIFLAPAWGWGIVVGVVALLALAEYLTLLFPAQRGAQLVGGALGLTVVGAALSAPAPGSALVAALTLIVPVTMIWIIVARRDLDAALSDAGRLAIGVLYAGLLAPYFYWVRELPDGSAWVTFVIAVAMAGDSGGYFVGRAWGRHKLIPHLSPGKTVEGALGILTCSLLCGALAKLILFPTHGWIEILVLSLVMGVIGQFGDLGESVIKRAVGAKESGTIFPGHGGVLDRVDSLLFPVALVYYYRVALAGAGAPA